MAKSAKLDLAIVILIGSRIRFYRACAGMTQKELGDRLGVTAGQVGKYERGKDSVDAATLFSIARILGCNVSDFFEGLDDPSQSGEAGSEKLRRFMASLGTVPVGYRKLLFTLSRPSGQVEEE